MTEGTDMVPDFESDVAKGKEQLARITDILLARCKDEVDANNVGARLHVALQATAHHGQEDLVAVEEAVRLGLAAFVGYETQNHTGRRTRSR